MHRAIQAVKDRMSVRQASEKFGVPRSTLHDRATDSVKETLGRPTQLSPQEESIIVERAILMGEWGFPLVRRELRELVKGYLDHIGKKSLFKV